MSGWNNANEITVPGNGQAYVAPVGTTLPADNSDPTAALNAAFFGLGYWTTDGATFTATPDIKEVEAFQSAQAVRRGLNKLDVSAAFVLEQWNEETVPTALGGTISTAGGFSTYTPPTPGAAISEVSLVVDIQDGDRNMRFVFPRGNTSTEAVETKFTRGEPALLPVTFKALLPTDGSAPYRILFDDATAFAAGS